MSGMVRNDGSKKNRKNMVDSDGEVEDEKISPTPSVNSKEITQQRKPKKDRVIKKEMKKVNKLKEDDYEQIASSLIREMKNFYSEDLKDMHNRKPGLRRIDNIESICRSLIKKELQEALLKVGLLQELKRWLEPFPNGMFPSLKVKRSILELLPLISVSKNDLLVSGIGKIIHFYSKNSKEIVKIRKLAKIVMKKWKQKVIREELMDD